MKGDCETISRLMEEKVRLEQRSVMLDRLLFEVSRKFPCETRFDTALRYIREAEARANETGQAQSVVPNAEDQRRRSRPLHPLVGRQEDEE